MSKRIAVFGDVHGCIHELTELHKMLQWESLDEIRHCGDLVDRGPDSAAVVAFCRENNIQGVKGNHDGVIVNWIDRGQIPRNPDKARTISQLTNPLDVDYLRSLPYLHVDDALNLVTVHGGLLPSVPFQDQTEMMVCRLAMINPKYPGKVRWFGLDRNGVPEEENRKDGWVRWYEVYDHHYDVVFGHTVFQAGPFVHKNENSGRCIGVDTGCNWSGQLTAVIMPDLKFIQTPKTRDFTIIQPGPEDDK